MGKKYHPTKSKTLDSLWIMQETKNITTGLEVKLNRSASLYYAIRGSINTKQGKAEPNDAFKISFDNVYDTTELSGWDNILCREQLTTNGSQVSSKKKNAN